MNNEPVAWRNLCVSNIGEDFEWIYNEIGQGEPLYTHPVKELTNEEISDIRDQFFAPKDCNIYTFAKALLKKAQEND